MSELSDDTGRRCPRCDCPDGAEQCDHCKVCPHADVAAAPENPPRPSEHPFVYQGDANELAFRQPKPEYAIALYEDDGTLTLGIRHDGAIVTGPNYRPDEAAREFWDAVTRAAQAANPWEVR